jgi:hypothetical protein
MDVNMSKHSAGSSKKIAAAFKKAPAKLKPKKSTRKKYTAGATKASGDVMKALHELQTLMKTIVDSTTQPQTKIILPIQFKQWFYHQQQSVNTHTQMGARWCSVSAS